VAVGLRARLKEVGPPTKTQLYTIARVEANQAQVRVGLQVRELRRSAVGVKPHLLELAARLSDGHHSRAGPAVDTGGGHNHEVHGVAGVARAAGQPPPGFVSQWSGEQGAG